MRRVSALSFSPLSSLTVGKLFSAQRNLFFATGVRYACRNDAADREYELERWAALHEKAEKFEKQACIAGSLLAKTHVILREAEKAGKVQIPVTLARAVSAQLAEHRNHRIEDHQFEMQKTDEELRELQSKLEYLNRQDKERNNLLAQVKELMQRLSKMKKVDVNSDDFLDRDTSTFGSQKP